MNARFLKSIATIVASVAGFMGLGTAQAKDQPQREVELTQTAACDYFTMAPCEGKQSGISLRFNKGNKSTVIGLAKFGENAGSKFISETLKIDDVARIDSSGQWDAKVEGIKAFAAREYRFDNGMGFSVGGYAGKIRAQATLDADVVATVKETTLDIPALVIPAMPEYGTPAINIPGMQLTIPASVDTLYEHAQRSSGESYYGGLTQASGYTHALTSKVALMAGQSARVGFDMISGTVNLGVVYATRGLSGSRLPMGDVCQGANVSGDGLHFMANLCVNKVFKHPVYDKLLEKADELAGKANAEIAAVAADVKDYTGVSLPVPVYSGKDILKEMDVHSPYKVQPSFNFAVSGKMGAYSVKAGLREPLGSDKGTRMVSVSLSRTF